MAELEAKYLYPAQLTVAIRPLKITTVLGSCVAVCLYDPVSKIGGINHFMLPLWNGEGLATPKYGDVAINKLIEAMLAQGATHSRLQAKVFGGSENFNHGESVFNIGQRNIIIAKNLLEQHRINILGSSLGGNRGRHIKFLTHTGEIFMRYVKDSKDEKTQGSYSR